MPKKNGELVSPEFWTQPDGVLGEEPLQLIYSEVVAAIRGELKDIPRVGILETMIAERTAFIYVNIRARENYSQGFASDRNYKEMMSLWMSLVAELRKAKNETTNPDEVKQVVISQLAVALDKVLSKLDTAVALAIREELAAALDAV